MTGFNNWITEKWSLFTWTGPKKAPYGELIRPASLPPVDYSDEKEKPITTTVDCYCTGTYIDDRGKLFTIRERYSLEVTYSNSTIIEAMTRLRNMVISKFEQENPSYQIGDVFVPQLLPELKKTADPRYLYRGGRIYKYLTRIEEGKLMLGTEKQIYKSRAESIIKKYGLKKSEGTIKRV